MGTTLPARGSFPDLEIPGKIAPGLPHVDEHVENIVEEQHYIAAYYGRMHASENFALLGNVGNCTASTRTLVLEYLVMPRMHMKSLEWRMRVSCTFAPATITVEVDCVESGATSIQNDATGTATRYLANNIEIEREDQLTTIQVYLTASAGTVAVESFALWDKDLAQSECHFDYYKTPTDALSNDMVRYWPLQEMPGAGTNATGEEILSGADDLSAYNGVTIDSEGVNKDRIFHRVFGPSDYMEATWAHDSSDFTAMIEINDTNVSSGQRTYLALGEAGSVGGSVAFGDYLTSGLLLEVGANRVYNPTFDISGWKTYFLVHDSGSTTVTLYAADGEGTVETVITNPNSPVGNGDGVRIGNGFGTFGYFDAGDYLNSGEVRSCAIWYDVSMSEQQMNAIARHLRYRGSLVVR